MNRKWIVVLLALALPVASALAQVSPVGTWNSIDDKTGAAKAEIVIGEQGGVLVGRITRLLREGADQNGVCDRCTDDRKDQRLIGLEIIRDVPVQPEAGDNGPVWKGGRILDPEKGSTYALRMTPVDGGAMLDVRGSIGPFGRTQTWKRVAQ